MGCELNPWECVTFSWGTAIRHRKGKWDKLFLSPSGQEVDVSGLDVILHDNGIEFTKVWKG